MEQQSGRERDQAYQRYREDVGRSVKEAGLTEHLVLLSIYQTCRVRDISFLKFLLSRERDIDTFAAGRRRRQRAQFPRCVVIMDNLGSRKSRAVRQLIRSAGAKLFFLPKYSPDLNPIEQVFAKIKHLLRKAAARTVETICTAIAELLGSFTPAECANYFRNSGYAPI